MEQKEHHFVLISVILIQDQLCCVKLIEFQGLRC